MTKQLKPKKKYNKRTPTLLPMSIAEVRPECVYLKKAIGSVFPGTSDWLVRKWISAGQLRPLPDTGAVVKFSGTEILRFAREVMGVETGKPSNQAVAVEFYAGEAG